MLRQQQPGLPLSQQTSLLFQPPLQKGCVHVSSTRSVQVRSIGGHWENLPQPCSCPLCSSIFPSTSAASDPSLPLCLQQGHLSQLSPAQCAQGNKTCPRNDAAGASSATSKEGRCQQQGAGCPVIAPCRCHGTLEAGHSTLQKHQ